MASDEAVDEAKERECYSARKSDSTCKQDIDNKKDSTRSGLKEEEGAQCTASRGGEKMPHAEASSKSASAKRKRRSGWSSTGTQSGSASSTSKPENQQVLSGFASNEDSGSIGDAAAKSSRLYSLVQQMGLTADQIRAAREVYVGNLPSQIEVPSIVEFLNAALLAVNGNLLPGLPAVRGWRASEGHFVFVEFRTMEEANNGLAMNGINCHGYSLRIGRPKTYPEQLQSLPAAQQTTLPPQAGVTNGILTGVSLGTTVNKEVLGGAFSEAASRTSGTIITSVGAVTPPPDAMCMRNLPPPKIFSEDRARELLTAFGSLKFFLFYGIPRNELTNSIARDYISRKDDCVEGCIDQMVDEILAEPHDESMCFFEYHNPLDSQNLTDEVDSLKLAGCRPRLIAAEVPLAEEELTRVVVHHLMQKKCLSLINQDTHPLPVPTRCLFFGNLVRVEELGDDAEYADILDDVRLECRLLGRVISIEMPRPNNDQTNTTPPEEDGIGYVFVEFSTVEEACRGRKALNGRRFAGRRVQADFFSERRYLDRAFGNPSSNIDPDHSTTFRPDLACHVPAMLKQMEELERVGREAARAAATAAANASFTGSGMDIPSLPSMAALIDVAKPSFDEDVDRDEEAMEED